MNSITLGAPAKINLYLDIISRRKDSYHNISTIFCRLALSDNITISRSKGGISVSCDHPKLSCQRQNLAYKAALLMKERFKAVCGLEIKIKKNIPIAAGLGGGSSDAASVILGIDKIFDLKLKPDQLLSIGRPIGADVGFFLSGGGCAVGRGIGDRLTRVDMPYESNILLVVPRIHIYTKSIYEGLSLRLTKPAVNATMLSRILINKDWPDKLANSLYNRLEDIVLPLYPVVKEAKQALGRFTDKVLLSGSGPSIFGIFNTRKLAEQAEQDLAGRGEWDLFLTRNR